MTDLYPLYAVLDVGADGIVAGQHVEIDTSLADAKARRDELHTMAIDDREVSDFRVFQLVEPGAGEARFDLGQLIRHEALNLSIALHRDSYRLRLAKDGGIEPHATDEVMADARRFAAWLEHDQDGEARVST